MKNHYATLGIERTATTAEIRKAYRKLALRFHPDRNPGDREAERRFKEVSEAHDVLADPGKRARHDADLDNAPRPAAAWASAVRPGPRPARKGPTFSTGPVEMGGSYSVRRGPIEPGKTVPLRPASSQSEMPWVELFVKKGRR